MYPDLLILCATAHEAAPFLAQYPDSHECVSKTGVRILEGKIGGCFYQLALTGPGVFNTAHALTVLLEHQTPGLILQTGIAGVFKASGLGIGDVAVGTQARYIHTGVIRSPDQITPLPFDLINERVTTRQGVYETDPGLLGRCLDRLIQEFLQTGVIVRK
jgi:futalosine hydrolase